MLTYADVKAEIERLAAPVLDRERVDAERVLEELGRIGFSNMADYTKVDPLTRTVSIYFPDPEASDFRARMAAVEEITQEEFMDGHGEGAERIRKTKFKLGNRKGALDTLAKILAMIVTRQEVTGKDGGPVMTAPADAVQAALAGADETERGLLRQILEHRKAKANEEKAK